VREAGVTIATVNLSGHRCRGVITKISLGFASPFCFFARLAKCLFFFPPFNQQWIISYKGSIIIQFFPLKMMYLKCRCYEDMPLQEVQAAQEEDTIQDLCDTLRTILRL
jgi:hypothetical protein